MIATAIFLVFFVGGPLIFRAMTKAPPSLRGLKLLALMTISFAVAGLLMRYVFATGWGMSLWLTGLSVLLLWVAWIGVLAFATQALRRNDPSRRMYLWTGIIGALGTTVPWFGLASANLING